MVSDFNGDRKPDLAIVTGQEIVLLAGNGDGTFQPPVTLALIAGSAVAAGDFNGDGIPDLAVTNIKNNSVSILLGDGKGSFRAAGIVNLGSKLKD